jgi:hypothetical protein
MAGNALMREAGCFLLGVVLTIVSAALGAGIALGSDDARCTTLGPKGELALCVVGRLNFRGGA